MGSAHARGGLNEVTVATGTVTQLVVLCLCDDDEGPVINDQLLYLLP